jgi:hypothetical protein
LVDFLFVLTAGGVFFYGKLRALNIERKNGEKIGHGKKIDVSPPNYKKSLFFLF